LKEDHGNSRTYPTAAGYLRDVNSSKNRVEGEADITGTTWTAIAARVPATAGCEQ
jgi:hypothetical protein